MEPRNPRLDLWLLSLTGRPRPRVLFVPTASGDAPDYITRFHRSYARHACEHEHLLLFNRTVPDLRRHVLAHDLIFVGGGNTANMLAVWRAHGMDAILREAWERGIVLAGISAGAICWFESGVTDSFGPKLAPLHGGLGFLPGSFCPHYDGERARQPVFRRLTASGELPDGYAADDGAGMLFEGTALAEVRTSRPNARAFRMVRGKEQELPVSRLSAPRRR
jgi:peptidase E